MNYNNMQGYGYYQQGYDYQQAAYQQQQQQQWAYAQQGYPQGGYEYGYAQYQQQQVPQQQWGGHQQQHGQQGYGQQQQSGGDDLGSKGGKGGKGGDSNKGAKGGKGKGSGGGGKDGGQQQMSLEQYQAMKSQKKSQKPVEMTFEEHQAQQAAKKAAQKANQVAKLEKTAKPTPESEQAPSEKQAAPQESEVQKPAEPETDDWETQAEEPQDSEPAPAEKAPAQKEESPKEDLSPEPEKEDPVCDEPESEIQKQEDKEEEREVKQNEPDDKLAEECDEEPEEKTEEAPEQAQATGDGKKELKAPDPRPHLNVVFIGHVDAGKSTTCGSILYLCGCVDERTIEKYQKEARDKNRESWFLAYIMDTNEEEKAKGKTVEVGRAHFETSNRRFTILDAPGHKSYVPNMIAGASQADIGVLIISARKGEFETGFERGGQTREHALLAKTLGVDKLVLTINKMDDPSVEWQKSRYDEIVKKLQPFLKSSGFKEDQVVFLPISGLTGDNVKERKKTPEWYTGQTLLDTLDTLNVPARKPDAPLRIPMLDGYKDMGQPMAIGKVEQGTVKPGMKCIVMPTGHKCSVVNVTVNEEEMQYGQCGENVIMRVHGITEDQLNKGFILCPISDPVRVVSKFKAQLQVIELPEERPVMTSGYRAVIHVHVAIEECEILKLYESMSMTDRKKKEKNPRFVRENSVVTCSISLARPTSVDAFTGTAQLGRFTLRDEGRTIAIGKITELPKA